MYQVLVPLLLIGLLRLQPGRDPRICELGTNPEPVVSGRRRGVQTCGAMGKAWTQCQLR